MSFTESSDAEQLNQNVGTSLKINIEHHLETSFIFKTLKVNIETLM